MSDAGREAREERRDALGSEAVSRPPTTIERVFVLGIDPGLSRCGYGAVEQDGPGRPPRAIAAGVVTTPSELAVPLRLALLRGDLDEIVGEYRPDVVVVERVFFQTNARTAMSVGQASGVALLTAIERGCSVAEYTSNEVKQAVTGYGSATKEQVQAMVTRLLGLDVIPRPADVADALGLALCHLVSAPLREAAARAAALQ